MAQGEALSRTETPDAPLHLSIPRPHGPVPGRPGVSVRRRSRGAARGASSRRRARISMLEPRGLGGRAPGHDLALAADRLSALSGEARRACLGVRTAGPNWGRTFQAEDRAASWDELLDDVHIWHEARSRQYQCGRPALKVKPDAPRGSSQK